MSWLSRLVAILRPAPRPVAPPAPAGPPDLSTAGRDLLAAVNAARAARGLPALKPDPRLEGTAGAWAAYCAAKGALTHLDGGSTPWTRIRAAGVEYRQAGECGAWGQVSASQVVTDWVSERPPGPTGHRDAVLSRDFTHAGGGAAVDKYRRIYWFVDFCREP